MLVGGKLIFEMKVVYVVWFFRDVWNVYFIIFLFGIEFRRGMGIAGMFV